MMLTEGIIRYFAKMYFVLNTQRKLESYTNMSMEITLNIKTCLVVLFAIS